jgi:hypothetical protein
MRLILWLSRDGNELIEPVKIPAFLEDDDRWHSSAGQEKLIAQIVDWTIDPKRLPGDMLECSELCGNFIAVEHPTNSITMVELREIIDVQVEKLNPPPWNGHRRDNDDDDDDDEEEEDDMDDDDDGQPFRDDDDDDEPPPRKTPFRKMPKSKIDPKTKKRRK